MSKFVMHAYTPPNGVELRLQLDDHWFNLPTLEPVEIPEDFYAEKLVETYQAVYGLIMVESVRTREGSKIDIDVAEKRAYQQLRASEDFLINNWVAVQMEERVKEGKPVMPPVGRVKEAIEGRKIDLKAKYGLSPVGYDYHPETGVEKAMAATGREAQLEKENAALKLQVASNDDKLARLMAHIGVTDAEIAPVDAKKQK